MDMVSFLKKGMSLKKILFVTKDFLPAIGGGIRRIEALYKAFLVNKGLTLEVVTAESRAQGRYKDVQYISQLLFKDKISSGGGLSRLNNKVKIKFLDKALIGWLPNVIFRIFYKKYDLVYCTVPTFTNLLIGFLYKLVRMNKPKLIVEYRDMYSFNPEYKDGFSKKFLQIIEKLILRNCDYIVVTTQGMKNVFSAFIEDNKIWMMRNYVSKDDLNIIKKLDRDEYDKRYFHIGYVGTLNTGRHPEVFLGMLRLKVKNKESVLHFVGITEAQKKGVLEIMENRGLDNTKVIFHGKVSRLIALKYMKSLDALFLIINKKALIKDGYGIPGKLYDYIQANNNLFADSVTFDNLSSEFNLEIIEQYDDYINFSLNDSTLLNDKLEMFIDKLVKEL